MSVYKPKNSPYYHFDFQIDGQRFCGSTYEVREHLAKKYELDERLKARKVTENGRNPTLDLAIWEYWDRHAKHKKSSRDLEIKLERLNSRIGPNTVLSFISNKTISDYIQKRREEVSNSSVNRDIELLRSTLFYCKVNLDYKIPDINWRNHFLGEPKGRTRYLTDDEEKELFKHIREDYKPLVNFCLVTGCRVSSAIRLKWSDVSEHSVKLYLKSIEDDFLDLLIGEDMREVFESVKGDHETYVFTYKCKRRGKRERDRRYPFTQSNWRREWKRALEAAKIGDFRFHDLRHTAATRLLRDTKDITLVKEVLGHRDIKSTLRYAHVNKEDIYKALSRRKSRTD